MSDELQEISVLSLKNFNIKVCDSCLNKKPNFTCPNFLNCQYQKNFKANVVVHDYVDKKEILIFKDAFWQRGTCEVNTDVDRTRKFVYDENGVLVPKDENESSVFGLLNRLKDSRKRSLQNMYSFINANQWDYWLTLTIENTSKVNKYDDEQVKHIWKIFRERIQYYFKDIKIFTICENHKKGGLHFHGLIGNCSLEKYLTIAINSALTYKYKGVERPNPYYLEPLKTEYGDQVYNLDPKLYNFGFVSIVKIKGNNNFKLANYMSKYMAKDCIVKYNKKLYFRTYNLNVATTQCSFLTDEEKEQVLNEANILNTLRIKETDKLYSVMIKK